MAGLGGLVAFPITPTDPDGTVDLDALRVLVDRLLAAEVDAIGLLGSTGSYPYLSRGERRRAIEAVAGWTGGRVPVLAGIGALRTDEAVALATDAREAGAACGLLAAVSYTPLTADEVFVHVAAVAEAGLPVCLYDNPSTTHFTFTPDLIGRLATVPGVVAAKVGAPAPDGVATLHAALRAAVPDGFSVGYSVDWHATEALIAGGDAWYGVAAGLFPEPCRAIVAALKRGEADEARRLSAALEPLWDLFRRFSSLRVTYAAARHLGLVRHDPPRPVLPLGPEPAAAIARVVDRLGLR